MRKEEKGITRESYNWVVRVVDACARVHADFGRIRLIWQNLTEVDQASRIRQNLFKVSELFYRVFYRDVPTVTRPPPLHLHMVVFLLSLLPIAISCKYSTFLRSTIFELTFLFLFKLRGELFYFKKPWLSIPEVKVKHLSKSCLFLILLYKSLGKENLTN